LPWLPWNINNPNPQFSTVRLTNLNDNNIKDIEAMGLKLLHRGTLEWRYLRTKFHENLQSGSKVISGGHRGTQTERQAVDLISLLSFF
jgi:hypothetical protein